MVFFRFWLFAALLCLLSACGGGSAGGSDDDDGGNDDEEETSFDPPVDNAEPLVYEGVKLAAILDATNASYFIYNALGESKTADAAQTVTADASATVSGFSHAAASAGGNNADGIAVSGFFRPQSLVRLRSSSRLGKKPSRSDRVDNAGFSIAAVSDSYDYAQKTSEDCDSGRLDTYLMLNQDGSGRMVLDYRICRENGVITNGLVTYEIHESDIGTGTITHATLSFNRFTTTVDGQDFISSGSIEFERDGPLERTVINVIYELANGGMLELENMVFDVKHINNFYSGDFTEAISGRYHDSAYGYVDVTTLEPVEYVDDTFVAGEIALTGENGSKVLLQFSGAGFTVRLDADGDDVYENTAVMNLARLASPENSDLGDDDGDGMHNSWEIFYGLDPENSGDANSDLDGDTVSNKEEYRVAYFPDDSASIPPFSDLGLSENVSTWRNPAGYEASLNLVLVNDGPDDAGNVSFTINMPPEFNLESARVISAGKDCAIEGNIVSCRFNMSPDPTDAMQIVFISPEAGTYNYEATLVSNSSYDPDTSNNIINGQITINPATAELAVRFLSSEDPKLVNEYVQYRFEIENTGALTATDLEAELEVAEGMTIPGSLNYGCSATDRVINCDIRDLRPGQKTEMLISVAAPLSPGTISSSVTVSSVTAEVNVTDNTDVQENEIINSESDVYFNNLDTNKRAHAGNIWDVLIQPESNGPDYPREILLTVDLPQNVGFVYASTEYPGGCTGSDPLVCRIDLSSLTNGVGNYSSLYIRFDGQIPGIYDLPLTISTYGTDPDSSNNSIVTSVFVGQSLDPIMVEIENAGDGETVSVAPGYYYGDLIYTAKNINLVATGGPENTFWSPGVAGLRINNASFGEVTGFTFTGGLTTAVRLHDSDVNIHGNVFDKAFGSAIEIHGTTSAIIEKNIIRDISCNLSWPGYESWPGLIAIPGDSDPVIRNNILLNNDCAGIFLVDTANSPAVIVNNNFIGNETGTVMPGTARMAGAYVGNNIFQGNGVGVETVTDCGVNCTNLQSNLLYDNDVNYLDSSDQTGINGNISADPLFTDAANEDFTLQAGSPAIDAGNALHAPTDDFTGNTRPVDGNGSSTAEPDIGVYEFQPPD